MIFRSGTGDRKAITTLAKPQMTKEDFWCFSQLNTDLTKYFPEKLFLRPCSPGSRGHATKPGNSALEAPLQFSFADFQRRAQLGSADNAQVLTLQLVSVPAHPTGKGEDQAWPLPDLNRPSKQILVWRRTR